MTQAEGATENSEEHHSGLWSVASKMGRIQIREDGILEIKHESPTLLQASIFSVFVYLHVFMF